MEHLKSTEHDAFWTDYEVTANNIPDDELIFSAGGMTGYVGKTNSSFEDCHGGYGFGDRNEAGEKILRMCQAKGWIVINTMFKKQDELST